MIKENQIIEEEIVEEDLYQVASQSQIDTVLSFIDKSFQDAIKK